MTFRYYTDQLARMEPTKRQQLERCAAARTEKWIDVPMECIEPAARSQMTSSDATPTGAPKASSSYRPEPTPAASLTGGPGDLVKVILDTLGIKPIQNCGCGVMRQRMNEWGYRGCWEHRHEIVDWFSIKAAEAGMKVSPVSIVRVVVDAALRGKPDSG